MNTKFTVEIPDDFSTEHADILESVVMGAYPHVVGEWDGDYWVLHKTHESSEADFMAEVEYIKLAGGIVDWEE